MRQKVKVQVYVTAENAETWKALADKQGVNLSDWVIGKVFQGLAISESLVNLHAKVDRLLEAAGQGRSH